MVTVEDLRLQLEATRVRDFHDLLVRSTEDEQQ